MGRIALDSRISEGTEDQLKQVTLQAFQDQATILRTAEVPQGTAPAKPGERVEAQPPGDQAAAVPFTRAQSTLVEAIQGFRSEPDKFKAMDKYAPVFETAILQADTAFNQRMPELVKDYEANKPAVEKAESEMSTAELAISASLRGISNPEHQKMAAVLALKYLQSAPEDRFEVDKVFAPFPEVANALKGMVAAQTNNEAILAKMVEWKSEATRLLDDRFKTRLVYGAAMDETGMSSRAQDMYKQAFGLMGQPVPKQLLPKRDPNIREA